MGASIVPHLPSIYAKHSLRTVRKCLFSDYDVDQFLGHADDLLHGGVADEGGDAGAAQGQGADLLFAGVGGDFDAFAHLAVDLDDQGKVFVPGQLLLVGGPCDGVNAAAMAGHVPQFFTDMRSQRGQQLQHGFQGVLEGCAVGDLFVLPAGGSKIPFSAEVLENKGQYVRMKGREIFKNAVRTMSHCCQEALDANHVTADQVDWLIPHQANNRIIEAIADYYEFPKEKVVVSVHETGNTSAASIPLAFEMAKADGRIKRGQTILLTAFGAGLTSGSLLMRY